MSIRQQLAGFKNQLVTASLLAPTFSNERVAPIPRNVTIRPKQYATVGTNTRGAAPGAARSRSAGIPSPTCAWRGGPAPAVV